MGLILTLGGLGVGVWQAELWLHYGVWQSFPLSQAWTMLNNGRPMPLHERGGGAQQIISWVFDQSTALAMLCAGVPLVGVGMRR
jgi:hypothetical protein